MGTKWLISIGAAILVPVVLSEQSLKSSSQIPDFRGSVDLVSLHVAVTDGARRHVPGLSRDDFLVFENNRAQEVIFFQATQVLLDVALVMDSSASMKHSLPIAQRAAIGFVRTLGAADAAAVIDFDHRVRIQQPLTRDAAATERAIWQTRPGGSTALYNAVYIALKELKKSNAPVRSDEERRPAVILLTDGEDTSSIVTVEDLLEVATQSGITIYTIGFVDRENSQDRKWQEANYALKQLARRTGGLAFFPKDPDSFDQVYHDIRVELSQQYLLAYASSNARHDGQYRKIDVRVARPDVAARTRAGYYARR